MDWVPETTEQWFALHVGETWIARVMCHMAIQLPDGATPPPCLAWVVENCRTDTTTCLPAAALECAFLSVCLAACLSIYLAWVVACPERVGWERVPWGWLGRVRWEWVW